MLQSAHKGWNGANSRHRTRLTAYCSGITSMGGWLARFCRMAPAVMLSSAARAKPMPAAE